MNIVLRYADPAGNITALVETPVRPHQRASVAKAILALGRAEQVGFAAAPVRGGAGRLEMMGGEFCGNAARSFGYLLAMERQKSGTLPVEISGAPEPVLVTADPVRGTAAAEMPLPLGLDRLTVAAGTFPLVRCSGICHVIAENLAPDPGLVQQLLACPAIGSWEAVGVLFLQKERLTPVVYVRSTDSLVWESSCGSGSMACGWYRSRSAPDGQYRWLLHQPGGVIETAVTVSGGAAIQITIGGPVSVSAPMALTL